MRRRIRDPHLVMEMTEAGQSSRTDIAICYMKDRVDKELLQNLKKRIETLELNDLRMNQQSLAEALFKRKWFNPFPKFKYTCLLYTSPSPRDVEESRMPSSA